MMMTVTLVMSVHLVNMIVQTMVGTMMVMVPAMQVIVMMIMTEQMMM